MATLKLKIEFNKGKPGIGLDKLEKVVESVRRFLSSLGEDIELLEPNAWVGNNFKNGSVEFVNEYPRDVEVLKLDKFNSILLAMGRSERPPAVRDYTANQFFDLAVELDIDGQKANMAVFSKDGTELPFEIGRKTAIAAQSLNLLPYRDTLGSVQGTIHSWYRESKEPYFVLRELSSRNLIKCFYEDDDYQAIYDALKNREQIVHVRGTVSTDTRKHEIRHVHVKSMILAEPFGYEDLERFLGASRPQ
jgi:hypothetical protein